MKLWSVWKEPELTQGLKPNSWNLSKLINHSYNIIGGKRHFPFCLPCLRRNRALWVGESSIRCLKLHFIFISREFSLRQETEHSFLQMTPLIYWNICVYMWRYWFRINWHKAILLEYAQEKRPKKKYRYLLTWRIKWYNKLFIYA